MRGIFVLKNEKVAKGSILQREKAKVLLFHHGSQKLSIFSLCGVADSQIPPEDAVVATYRRRLSSVVLS